MIDNFGRNIEYLRISVTERCTLKCAYCRSDEGLCPKKAELSALEFLRIVKAMAMIGIKKIRITGGEPLLRKDIVTLVEMFSQVPEIEEIAMTTNGQMLKEMVTKLKKAGLSRLNISLDSLNSEKYSKITGGGYLSNVLEGIQKAVLEELLPIKVNVVLVRGTNDDEIDDFIEFTRENAIDVRFIELMPMGKLGENPNLRIPTEEILAAHPELKPVPKRYPSQPSIDYMVDGHKGRVGFISPVSHKFCGDCNRVRIMSDGMLRTCLGDNAEVLLKPALLQGDDALLEVIRKSVFDKPKGHCFEKGFKSVKDMSMIGG
jgi:GTP 3',8-cyclase